jgi:hypothetical protein
MRFSDGDQEILAPENFYFPDPEKPVLLVEIGEMKDHEIVIVVNINFGALVVLLFTVFDVEGMEMEIIPEVVKVIVGGINDMVPSECPDFNSFDHSPSSLLHDEQ